MSNRDAGLMLEQMAAMATPDIRSCTSAFIDVVVRDLKENGVLLDARRCLAFREMIAGLHAPWFGCRWRRAGREVGQLRLNSVQAQRQPADSPC